MEDRPAPIRPSLGPLLLGGGAALYVGNWTNLGHGTLILVSLVQIVAAAVIERASQREER